MRKIGIIMNGVTGRMGTNQHLDRSIVAIRKQGGIKLKDQSAVLPDPILLGRDPEKAQVLAAAWGIKRWSTNLNQCLVDPDNVICFDAQATPGRRIGSLFESRFVFRPPPAPVLGTGLDEGAR